MIGYVFPGQGAQFVGMGKELYDSNANAKQIFERANDVLGFKITDVIFSGTDDELKETKVTQPSVFIHSYISATVLGGERHPDMVAGHSLGEFTALALSGALTFEDALTLVSKRAQAMQKACELQPSTMAAVIGLSDEKVVEVCQSIGDDIVVAANFNCPGQVVISGTLSGIERACQLVKDAGAKRALPLKVGGAFHSPLMETAREELAQAIAETSFSTPICPVYQNVDARPHTDADEIRDNLNRQLTAPVLWTPLVRQMVADGCGHFVEYGPGSVLQGLIKKIDTSVTVEGFSA